MRSQGHSFPLSSPFHWSSRVATCIVNCILRVQLISLVYCIKLNLFTFIISDTEEQHLTCSILSGGGSNDVLQIQTHSKIKISKIMPCVCQCFLFHLSSIQSFHFLFIHLVFQPSPKPHFCSFKFGYLLSSRSHIHTPTHS